MNEQKTKIAKNLLKKKLIEKGIPENEHNRFRYLISKLSQEKEKQKKLKETSIQLFDKQEILKKQILNYSMNKKY